MCRDALRSSITLLRQANRVRQRDFNTGRSDTSSIILNGKEMDSEYLCYFLLVKVQLTLHHLIVLITTLTVCEHYLFNIRYIIL